MTPRAERICEHFNVKSLDDLEWLFVALGETFVDGMLLHGPGRTFWRTLDAMMAITQYAQRTNGGIPDDAA